MNITCKNCGQIYKGHFCNNCGQTAETHKINAHFLWHDFQHGLFHFDGGIPYSLKQLFTRPGHTIRDFIEGKRVRHFKPLSLVAVLGALYGFLYHYYNIDLTSDSNGSNLDLHEYKEWMTTHFSWITIATIPFYTFGTYIVFRKQGYNFFEFFVLNTFKAAQRLFVQVLTFPVLLYLNSIGHAQWFSTLTYILGVLLIFWTNMQFFNRISRTKAFYLSLLSHLLFLICFVAFSAIILLLTDNLPK